MLAGFKGQLETMKIVLASSSPRRQSLLRDNLGLDFTVMVPDFAEDVDKSSCRNAEDYVSRTCKFKAQEVAIRVSLLNRIVPIDVIIAADTIVVLDDTILEKPSSVENAIAMLANLSGRKHCVLTAVTIAYRRDCHLFYSKTSSSPTASESMIAGDYMMRTFCCSTEVTFAKLSPEIISSYVATGEPLDKAGGYGIQSLGSSLVTNISGCYFNIVGFPLNMFCSELSELFRSKDA
jgi:septum formation protein